MGSHIISDRYAVLICLTGTALLLCYTMWQQRRILMKYPDVKDQRRRFHAGALSLFFSPTAGHVWFSLVFPWLVFMLVDYWLFHGQITRARLQSPLPWTVYAVLVLTLCLPLLCFQQLERELERLRHSHRLEKDRQAIRKHIAVIRARQRQGGGAIHAVIKR